MDKIQLPPLSLYVHIPWCVRKCPYCDFNSHERNELPEQAYINALLADLDSELENVQGRPIHSIFFGGGTPSLFSPDAIHQILDGIAQRIPFSDDIEITLEANPGTVESGKFEGFYQAGVNRLSIGVQSFQADMLPRLGRIHGRDEAIRAAEMAHKAGFADAKGFNLDLMFGLPSQTLDGALLDIQTALDLNPSHISHYQLTLEPGTAFFYRPPALPKDDVIWDMQTRCQALLANNNFAHYEVSAYAQPGKQCQHNFNYWQFGDYIGIGAGAHGKITKNNRIQRTSKVKTPDKFLRFAGSSECIDEQSFISNEDLHFEFMLNSLRLVGGFDLDLYSQRTSLSIDTIQDAIDRALSLELISLDKNWLQPTESGKRYLNNLIELFL